MWRGKCVWVVSGGDERVCAAVAGAVQIARGGGTCCCMQHNAQQHLLLPSATAHPLEESDVGGGPAKGRPTQNGKLLEDVSIRHVCILLWLLQFLPSCVRRRIAAHVFVAAIPALLAGRLCADGCLHIRWVLRARAAQVLGRLLLLVICSCMWRPVVQAGIAAGGHAAVAALLLVLVQLPGPPACAAVQEEI